jgi:mannose-6-phosphate isomerase
MSLAQGPRRLPRRPLLFEPRLRTRVWGGQTLKTRVPDPPDAPVGESWEVSDEDGALTRTPDGLTLRDLMRDHREDLVGRAFDAARPERFPLLLKLLDARADLSVQVHPNDEHAQRLRPDAAGKTECWYVLDADPGARIYRGLAPGTTAGQLEAAARRGDLGDLLHHVPVRPGDAVFVPAGTVHAIGAGIRLVEIQQTSDITYRVFDWNRPGMDGRPRELHLERALEVIDWQPSGPDLCEARELDLPHGRARQLVEHPKLRVRELSAFTGDPIPLDTGAVRFHLLTVVAGRARLEAADGAVDRQALDSALIPAVTGRYTLTPTPDATVLLFDRP